MPTAVPFQRTIRAALAEAADPGRALQMKAYMKSEMPYFGVPSPALKVIARGAIEAHPFESFEAWQGAVARVFHEATHREERYAALALAGHRRYRPYRTFRTLPLWEDLIVTGAWWDLVDELATHRLRELFAAHAPEMSKAMRKWSCTEALWKRRSAIICQNGRKADLDFALLRDCIEPALEEKEFFLRKAIGWALREHAKTAPDEVLAYVKKNAARLSGLSKREALKHFLKSGAISQVP